MPIQLQFETYRYVLNVLILMVTYLNIYIFQSEQVSRLVKIPGIIVSASGIKAKATKISIQCRSCRNVVPNLTIKPGLEGYILPRRCAS